MNDILGRSRPAVVLLVEDNDNDVELTRIGFKKSRLMVNLHHVKDGEECMDFLHKQGKFADAPTPDLILLDLNMPRKDGRQVMTEIADDDSLSHLPVVILTTSSDEGEILKLYKLRCSSYIVKPMDFEQFARTIQLFSDYWFTVVILPTEASAGKAA